jgi:DNA-binding response OmpR family regulator
MPSHAPRRKRKVSSRSVQRRSRRVDAIPDNDASTILVVEDDHSVSTIIRLTLRAEGYNILEASCGREALNMLETYRGSIQMLVMDIKTPGIDGQEMAWLAVSRRPGIKVLYLSGYFDGGEEVRRKDEGSYFMQKPFATGTLVRNIAGILDPSTIIGDSPPAKEPENGVGFQR